MEDELAFAGDLIKETHKQLQTNLHQVEALEVSLTLAIA